MFFKRISILFYFASLVGYTQEIKFELYLSDSCQDTIGKIPFYNLRKDGIDYYPKDNDGIIFLKDKGQYQLSTVYSEDVKIYDIKSYQNIVDTLKVPVINLCLEPATSYPNFVGYCCCDEKCEGEQVEYYSNGNKRIEGYFEQGKPIGKLKIYYSDGSLKQIDKYSKKGTLLKRKEYSMGECKK